MVIKVTGNHSFSIGKDAIHIEGSFGKHDIEVSGNYSMNVSGNAITIVHFQEIRDQFPELANVDDREMAQVAKAVKGKSYEEAVSALQNFAAFATIVTANWKDLLILLGWMA